LSTDKKNFETKKPHARKLFDLFSAFFTGVLWLSGIAAYLWLCYWLIGLLNQLVS
jgi:fatty acid desaturase